MNKLYSKYRTQVSLLILAAYIFLFGYNILHYHNYEFIFRHHSSIETETDNNNVYPHFINNAFQCPVHNTYSAVHNLILNNTVLNSFSLDETEQLRILHKPFYLQSTYRCNSSLRGPPVLFS